MLSIKLFNLWNHQLRVKIIFEQRLSKKLDIMRFIVGIFILFYPEIEFLPRLINFIDIIQ